MTPEQAQKAVLKALKDEGVDVYQVGTVVIVGDNYSLQGWDVQGVTRQRAIEIMHAALECRVVA